MDKFPELRLSCYNRLSEPTDGGAGWISPEEFYIFGGPTEEDDRQAAMINKQFAAQEIKNLEMIFNTLEFNKSQGDQ